MTNSNIQNQVAAAFAALFAAAGFASGLIVSRFDQGSSDHFDILDSNLFELFPFLLEERRLWFRRARPPALRCSRVASPRRQRIRTIVPAGRVYLALR